MDILYTIATCTTVVLFGLHIVKSDHNNKMLSALKDIESLEKKTDDPDFKVRLAELRRRVVDISPL
jgi:hypothetical protein